MEGFESKVIYKFQPTAQNITFKNTDKSEPGVMSGLVRLYSQTFE